MRATCAPFDPSIAVAYGATEHQSPRIRHAVRLFRSVQLAEPDLVGVLDSDVTVSGEPLRTRRRPCRLEYGTR